MDTLQISAVEYSQMVVGAIYLGSDMYTATTDVISGGRDGDVYHCNVTSSSSLTGSTTVRGI